MKTRQIALQALKAATRWWGSAQLETRLSVLLAAALALYVVVVLTLCSAG